MKEYGTEFIRNVALVGHGGAGKTSLVEAFLYSTGVTSRLGRVEDGTTVSDFEDEERRRRYLIRKQTLEAERRRETELAAATTAWNELQQRVADSRAEFVPLEAAAQPAFRGFSDFKRLLTAAPRVPDAELAPDEGKLLGVLEGLQVRIATGLNGFRKFWLARGFPAARRSRPRPSRRRKRASLDSRSTSRSRSPTRARHRCSACAAETRSDYPLFNGRELVFGKVSPGETREWSTTLGVCTTEKEKRKCVLPEDATDRADGVKINFEAAHGHTLPPFEIRTQVKSLARAQFSYQYQVADPQGDGDGRIERGETVTVYFDVQNTGKGAALNVTAPVIRDARADTPGQIAQFPRRKIEPSRIQAR